MCIFYVYRDFSKKYGLQQHKRLTHEVCTQIIYFYGKTQLTSTESVSDQDNYRKVSS